MTAPTNKGRRRLVYALLTIIALFLVGTVVVLGSIRYYLAIDPAAYLSEHQVPILDNSTRWNASDHGKVELIPRIIHQTWKTDILPSPWVPVSQKCRDMMPDYEYMLWTDDTSRAFIAEHYPWFINTFDEYTYPIQRADAIRYFVLYHYGGIYIDLDIGCIRPMDPLLIYPVILPKTNPVGLSNDLMFSVKEHPFFAQSIHNLVTFDHSWIINYPTVMFSTGPMFLSIQYTLFMSSKKVKAGLRDVLILPQSLYGKNAKEGEAPFSFFEHFYGSSWHADDAGFVWFLGTWGKLLMLVGLIILVVSIIKLAMGKRRPNYHLLGGGYDVRWSNRTGRWHHPRSSSPSGHRQSASSSSSTQLSSPAESECGSPIDHDVLELPFHHSSTPSADAHEVYPHAGASPMRPIFDAVRRVRNRMADVASPREEIPRTPLRTRFSTNRGVLFFLPAIFTQRATDFELDQPAHRPAPPHHSASRSTGKDVYAEPATELGRAGSSSQSIGTLVDVSDDMSRHETRSRSASSRSSPAPLL